MGDGQQKYYSDGVNWITDQHVRIKNKMEWDAHLTPEKIGQIVTYIKIQNDVIREFRQQILDLRECLNKHNIRIEW